MGESWPLSEHCLTTRADVELQGIGRNRASRKYPLGNPKLWAQLVTGGCSEIPRDLNLVPRGKMGK